MKQSFAGRDHNPFRARDTLFISPRRSHPLTIRKRSHLFLRSMVPVKQSFAGRDRSDHIALLRAYDGWRAAYREKRERDWCWENFLSTSTLHVSGTAGLAISSKLKTQRFENPRMC